MSANALPLVGDRLKRAISAFIRELAPLMEYMGVYEYAVDTWDAGSQLGDLSPTQNSPGMPQLARVPVRLPGISVDLPAGYTVLVGFEGYQPTAPYIAHLGKLGAELFPSHLVIGASAGPAAGRVGDSVSVTIPALSVVIAATGATLNPSPITLNGTITSGSSKVDIG